MALRQSQVAGRVISTDWMKGINECIWSSVQSLKSTEYSGNSVTTQLGKSQKKVGHGSEKRSDGREFVNEGISSNWKMNEIINRS